jgi:hypothetical protein
MAAIPTRPGAARRPLPAATVLVTVARLAALRGAHGGAGPWS